MNMTVLYIVFGIIFGIIILVAVGLGSGQLVIMNRRKALAERAEGKQTQTSTIESEDLTLRIRDGVIEAYDTLADSEPAEAQIEIAAEEPSEEEAVEGTFLARGEKLTFAEKLDRLPLETRLLLEEFCTYVVSQPDCERLQQTSAIALRYNKAQIAKIAIRRDAVLLNFAIVNPDLGRMMREEKGSSLKLRPVEIRLEDKDSLEVAKQTADLTINYLKQEEEYRAEKRREARREAARKKREEANAEA